jgi:hypothetical protein
MRLPCRLYAFQPLNQCTDFHEIWYERYTIGSYANLQFLFLKPTRIEQRQIEKAATASLNTITQKQFGRSTCLWSDRNIACHWLAWLFIGCYGHSITHVILLLLLLLLRCCCYYCCCKSLIVKLVEAVSRCRCRWKLDTKMDIEGAGCEVMDWIRLGCWQWSIAIWSKQTSSSLYSVLQGFVWEIAPEFRALIVFAEHRYYGLSLPFGNKSYSVSNLHHHSRKGQQHALTLEISAYCQYIVFISFVWLSQQTTIIPLYSRNWLVSVMDMHCYLWDRSRISSVFCIWTSG